MTTKTASFIVMLGLILTAGGVGGIELASDSELLGAMILSAVGLLTMYCGVLALRVSEYYDR